MDDTEDAGGERARGARGRAVAGDVLPGGVAVRRRFESVRMGVKDISLPGGSRPAKELKK